MKPVCRTMVMLLFMLFGANHLIYADACDPKDKQGEKEKKDGKSKEKENLTEEQKLLRSYQESLKLGEKCYANRPDIKFEVDHQYKELRRTHSEYAFMVNTYNSNDERITFTGDKLKTEDTLYDNPMVQDYVNRVGQSLVPKDSRQRYAFKVVLNPVPDARSLSTGTVYISTGLLSMVDNEAQLSYILAHEIAHIERRHWFKDLLVSAAIDVHNQAQEAKREKISRLSGLGGGLFGILAGDSLSSSITNGILTASLAASLASVVAKFVAPDKVFTWQSLQEAEADEMALKLIFERNYDPREVPKLYARLKQLSEREPRTADGFIAQLERINERVTEFNNSLTGMTVKPGLFRGASNLRALRDKVDGAAESPLKPGMPFGTADDAEKREKEASGQVAGLDERIRERLRNGQLIGSGPEFDRLMADLKRDNGIRAFYYDLFQMALNNLDESLKIRSDDPYTKYYYGKILVLTARNQAEKETALKSLVEAIDLDKRGVLAAPWLHRALAIMADRNSGQNSQAVDYLRKYVTIYQQEHSGALPPNMDLIYAYLSELGENSWVARPVTNISTRNIDPIDIARPAAPAEVTPSVVEKGPDPPPTPARQVPVKTTPRKGRI